MELRPLTLGELLDRAFTLYRRHLWVFVGIMALPAILGVVLNLTFQVPSMIYPPGTRVAPAEAARTMVIVFAAGVAAFVLYFVAYAVAVGATSIAVSQIYLGRDATIGSAYRAVRQRIGRVILVMLWMTLRIGGASLGLGILAAVIVGASAAFGTAGRVVSVLAALAILFAMVLLTIFMGMRYGVCVPAAVLEDVTAGGALRRSVNLTASNWWRVFLVVACAIVVTYATMLLVQGPFLIAQIAAGSTTIAGRILFVAGIVAGTIGSMFTAPVMIIGLVLIYYDLRIRKEAFDLHMMLETVGQ